jgi:hypothetical protein
MKTKTIKGKESVIPEPKVIGKVSIKPYTDPNSENMGLEKYNYVVFPNTWQVETLAAVEQNGKTRYLTGLNEFAPEIKQIKDADEKAAKISAIRETVATLERERAFNHLKVDDPDFWAKVEMFKPDNSEIWGKVFLKLGNDDYPLDTQNLDHQIIIHAIENGGFSLVATSFEEAKRTKKKWYLDRQINSIGTKTSVTKLRNKALSILQVISEEEPRKLFYIAKNLNAKGVRYTNATLNDIIYDDMDKFVNGLGFDNNKKRCADTFITSSKMSIEDLKIKAIIKDAAFYKYIITKPDGMLHEQTQNVMLGRNVADVLEYLKNPANDDMLDIIMAKVEHNWNKQ